jgi:hypothetical protein
VPSLQIRLVAAAALLAGLATAPALAQSLPPGGLFDLQGARALATSAATAGVTGTEAIFVNPGAMGVRTGYVAEALAVNERRGAATSSRYLGVAVVDGVSSPAAVSAAYLASTEGDHQGYLASLGLSGPLTQRMHVGVQGRYLKLGGARPGDKLAGSEPLQVVTADAGLSWDVTGLVTLGVAGFNLIPTGHPAALPQSMAAGLAVGTDTLVRVVADWRGTFLPNREVANRYAAGVAGLVGGMLALRAGWSRDELLHATWWSAGTGLVSGDGFSIDFGYKQSVERADAREMALSLRYYPPQ